MKADTYKTIEKASEGFFKDKGSKFFSYAYPLQNEEEVKEIINGLKKQHHSARHHCYAWRLGIDTIRHRANDDGEPSSTAGKPILGQLQSFELSNILVVVVRYFGGTLLGVSGLINAYRATALDAIQNAQIIEKIIEQKFEIFFTYNELNEVMQIIKQEDLQIISTDFQEKCSLVFSIRKSQIDKALALFKKHYKVVVKAIED